MLAWGEMWHWTWGAYCLARANTPTSARIIASTPSAGACAQPCRYQYALMEEKRPGEYSSSGEKLPAKERIPKAFPAR